MNFNQFYAEYQKLKKRVTKLNKQSRKLQIIIGMRIKYRHK